MEEGWTDSGDHPEFEEVSFDNTIRIPLIPLPPWGEINVQGTRDPDGRKGADHKDPNAYEHPSGLHGVNEM